jgi:predicted nucleic acid-binding protein
VSLANVQQHPDDDSLGYCRPAASRHQSKTSTFWNDLLIALCARQVGATVVTHNARDFEMLRRFFRFDLHILS